MLTKSKFHRIITSLIALTMLFSAIQPSVASAQSGDGIKRQVNAQSGRVSFIGPENGRVLSASRALGTFARPQNPAMALANRYAPEFGVKDPARELSEMKSARSEDGRVIVRYQQKHQGIPVMGGELIVNTNDRGDLYSMNGDVSPNLSLQTQPTIDSAKAAETALEATAKWYQATPGDFVASEPELWIFDESLLRSSTRPVELVWHMEVIARGNAMPVRELVLVNAERGGISLHFNQVDTALSASIYRSVREMETKNIQNVRSNMLLGSPSVITYSGDDDRNLPLPGDFLCDQTDPTCTEGANPHADSAHKYAIGTYNFYANNFSRDSMDNNGMTIISTVQYCSPDPDDPCPFDNALWNGEQMLFGSAYDFALADDIVAHEFTHAVTQYESDLFYYYQSGAINESLSDIFGEYYDQTNGEGNDDPGVEWIIGEDANLPAIYLRSMRDPTYYNDPDKMSSTYYYEGDADDGGVHWNSGVNNKAAYLMVDGDLFNGKNVSALGWEKTAAIYYEANANMLTSGADYSDLYYALQQACSNLIGQHGITSDDCTEVRDAVDAVEMNIQPTPNFNTDAPLCTVSGTGPNIFFADDIESGTSNWTFNNGSSPRWQLDSPYGPFAQSGLHFLFSDDLPEAITDATAQLASFVVPANAYLHFAHAYDFETNLPYYWDGGVLEYSINGGSTWVDAGSLMQYNGYRGTISPNWNNPLKGRSAFVGTSHGYISTRLNLESLAGKTVTFRWRMGLDDSGYAWGWWLDNIMVYNCASYTITGNAGVADVTLGYTDGTARIVTSNTDGSYVISVPPGWSGTVTPTHPCYTFDPPNLTYSSLSENMSNQDYAAIPKPEMVCVLSITRAGPSPTDAASVEFTVTFSEPVTNVDVADFALTTGIADASITNVSDPDAAYDATYTVTVDTGTGNGTLRLDVVDNNTIIDEASDHLGGDYTAGQVYTILKTTSFGDVPSDHPYFEYIEILYANGLTNGCNASPLLYCPSMSMNRAQIAKFFMTVQFGGSYLPPSDTPLLFQDNWNNNPWAQIWANDMLAKGLTNGCNASPLLYCPDVQIPREQVAKFALAIKHGNAYLPPPASGTLFADLTDVNYWSTAWAEQAYLEGLVPACGTDLATGKPKFCPAGIVDRGFAAFVIVTATGLLGP